MLVRLAIHWVFFEWWINIISQQASQRCHPRSTFRRLRTGDLFLLLPTASGWGDLLLRIRLEQGPVSYPVTLVSLGLVTVLHVTANSHCSSLGESHLYAALMQFTLTLCIFTA